MSPRRSRGSRRPGRPRSSPAMPVDGRQARRAHRAAAARHESAATLQKPGRPSSTADSASDCPGAADPWCHGRRTAPGAAQDSHSHGSRPPAKLRPVRQTAYSAGTSLIRSAEVSIPARQTDRAMILLGSTRSRYLRGDLGDLLQQALGQRGRLQAEGEELVVADDQLVLLRLHAAGWAGRRSRCRSCRRPSWPGRAPGGSR